MSIAINNQLLVLSLFLFSITWFLTYLFIRAGTFLKIFIFILSFAIFIPLERWDSLPLTLASFLGAITAYFGGVLSAFSSVKYVLIDTFYFIKDIFFSVCGFFQFIFSGINKAVSFMFSFLKPARKPKDRAYSNTSNQHESINNQGNRQAYEEHSQRAKEQFRQAREETQRQEEKQDTRSFEDIVGVNSRYTKTELKTAYKRSASRFHPDKHSHMSEEFRTEAEQEFKKIQKAYNILSGRLG